MELDWDLVSRQLLRALRGTRSQAALARRLRLSTQTITNWEAGRRVPSALKVFNAAKAIGVDVDAAFAHFRHGSTPSTEEALGDWLSQLAGDRSVQQLAKRLGVSRYRVSRWLTGDTKVPWPSFLDLVETLTQRLTDWVSCLVPIDEVPLLAPMHRQREAARTLAFERPLSEAMLRLAETTSYAALPKHEAGWFAERLHVCIDEEAACLSAMLESGVLTLCDGRYEPGAPMSIDTSASLEDMKALKLHWLGEVTRSLEEGRPGNAYGYNVISVSKADLKRVRELHLQYFRQLRAIVVESEPVETVALIGMQIVEFPP
ncbi:MAG: transcriptional regulator with XRE-family HTH domain [Polyangiales bacterium]|jgi:transcriptional regulator with XRE-family HTH domain